VSVSRSRVRSKPATRLGPGLLGCLLVVAVVCGLVAGCGRGGGSFSVVPVSGTITKEGKPAAGVHVAFSPSAEGKKGGEAGPGSTAVTDAAGKFTLQTTEAKPRKGAVAGKHRVTLTSGTQRAPDDDSIGPVKGQVEIPAKFSDGSMTFDVPAAGTDKADFVLEGPAATAPAGKAPAAASKWDT